MQWTEDTVAGFFLAATLMGKKDAKHVKAWICSQQHTAIDFFFDNYRKTPATDRPKMLRNIVLTLNAVPKDKEALHPRAMALIASRIDESPQGGLSSARLRDVSTSWTDDSCIPRSGYKPSAELLRDLRRLCRQANKQP
ncbi:MAG: hypothetical protein IPJ88_15200 [Myxococcales bacterium]|nr:MAG: hypothetical protein IPJ88_15200 [Myxococcales bacterium]